MTIDLTAKLKDHQEIEKQDKTSSDGWVRSLASHFPKSNPKARRNSQKQPFRCPGNHQRHTTIWTVFMLVQHLDCRWQQCSWAAFWPGLCSHRSPPPQGCCPSVSPGRRAVRNGSSPQRQGTVQTQWCHRQGWRSWRQRAPMALLVGGCGLGGRQCAPGWGAAHTQQGLGRTQTRCTPLVEHSPTIKRNEVLTRGRSYNTDEPKNRYAKWRSQMKKTIPCDSICYEKSRKGKCIGTENRSVVA